MSSVRIDARKPEGNAMNVIAKVTGWLRAQGRGKETTAAARAMMDAQSYDEVCKLASEYTEGEIEVTNREAREI